MTNYDVVKKLIGAINPVGETNTDNARFENLKAMCELMDQIDTALNDLAWDYRNDHQDSVKRAVNYAQGFLNKIKSDE